MKAKIIKTSDCSFIEAMKEMEINTIDDLKKLYIDSDNELIVSFSESTINIEIYDDYRE